MKNILRLLLIIIASVLVNAQDNRYDLKSDSAKILGVVMGISKYMNVSSLEYADRDALSFYNFLLSPAGGKADTSNIRLLLNEKATSYNFFEAMDNLVDKAEEGDVFYIYFAGHGDIERKTERQNGFLIGYNAPASCYAAGGCIGVRYLQDYVETLVNKNKTKVILIVDACRSGKLAGGSEGAEITALALKQEWKGITKMLSCQPGETSREGEKWGGGAGVFTYFLIRGMTGLADEDKDGNVSLRELSNYLDKNVQLETDNKQLPDLIGDKRLLISSVDRESLVALQEFHESKKEYDLSRTLVGDEKSLTQIKDISVLQNYAKFREYLNNENLIDYVDNKATDKGNALSIYRVLERNKNSAPILTSLKRELLAALQNKAQIIMNGMIKGYEYAPISSCDSSYKELKTAFYLVDSNFNQYNQIKYQYIYFKYVIEKDKYANIMLLEECIKTIPDAPFAYNGIALFYIDQNNFTEALKYSDKAIDLAKNWSWAWNSKGLSLHYLGQHEEAIKCYEKAIELQPDDNAAYNNKAATLATLGRHEEAIEFYDKAIERKRELDDALFNKGFSLLNLGKYEEAIKCYDNSIELNPDRINAWLNKGLCLYHLGKYEEAIKCNNKVIELNPDEITAWYNRACAYSLLKNKPEMLKSLKKVIELHPQSMEDSKKDPDFKEYWQDNDFKKLVK